MHFQITLVIEIELEEVSFLLIAAALEHLELMKRVRRMPSPSRSSNRWAPREPLGSRKTSIQTEVSTRTTPQLPECLVIEVVAQVNPAGKLSQVLLPLLDLTCFGLGDLAPEMLRMGRIPEEI